MSTKDYRRQSKRILSAAAIERAGKALPLSLAVAGNGLKAFPGVGTVAGGIAHAVAYGLSSTNCECGCLGTD